MDNNTKKHIEVLMRLANICGHSKENFQDAAARTENFGLKELFNKYTEQRRSFVQKLEEKILELGGNPEQEQIGPLIALNDLWMKLRTSITPTKDDDKSLLKLIRSSEISVLETYDDELQGDILETDLKHLLAYQRIEISKALLKIENLYFEQFPPADGAIKGAGQSYE